MNKKDEDDITKFIFCRFCEKIIICNEVRDHSHLEGKYRGPAHQTCNKNDKQNQKIFISKAFHTFRNYYCDKFFKTLIDKKKDEIKLGVIAELIEG